MTSLPERTPKKTTVPSMVALLSNGCKQAFPLFTVDLQRARHNIFIYYTHTHTRAHVGLSGIERVRGGGSALNLT
jgi:hypothetical protein